MKTERQVELEALLNDAMSARIRGDTEAAIAMSTKVLSMLEPSDTRLYWIAHQELGAVYLLMIEDYSKAEYHYQKAVEARQSSEWLSVGLFHALVGQGRWIAAMQEVVRFVRLRDSAEYRGLISDEFIRKLWTVSEVGPDVLRQLALEAKSLLAQRN